MAITFVAFSSPQALTTSVAVAYPAGVAAGDLLLLVAGSDVAALAVTGWTALAVQTGGGASVRAWWKTATGSESGTVTVTATAGTKGVACMAAWRPDSGQVLVPQADASASDTDSTSTAYSATGASLAAAAGDILIFWALFVATGGTFTSGATGVSSSHTAAGANASRVSARTASNSLQYVLRDRIFTGAGTGTPTLVGTGVGANASGPANMHLFRQVTPVGIDAGADASTGDATYPLDSTATGGSGTKVYAWSVLSGPSTSGAQFSDPAAADPTFTFAGGAGDYVLQVQVTDDSGSDTDTVTITRTASATPPLYLGSTDVAAMYVGSVDVVALYKGSTQIW